MKGGIVPSIALTRMYQAWLKMPDGPNKENFKATIIKHGGASMFEVPFIDDFNRANIGADYVEYDPSNVSTWSIVNNELQEYCLDCRNPGALRTVIDNYDDFAFEVKFGFPVLLPDVGPRQSDTFSPYLILRANPLVPSWNDTCIMTSAALIRNIAVGPSITYSWWIGIEEWENGIYINSTEMGGVTLPWSITDRFRLYGTIIGNSVIVSFERISDGVTVGPLIYTITSPIVKGCIGLKGTFGRVLRTPTTIPTQILHGPATFVYDDLSIIPS